MGYGPLAMFWRGLLPAVAGLAFSVWQIAGSTGWAAVGWFVLALLCAATAAAPFVLAYRYKRTAEGRRALETGRVPEGASIDG